MKLLDVVKERLDIKDENQDKKIQGYIDDITNKKLGKYANMMPGLM